MTPTARDQPDTLVRPARVEDVPGVVAVAATRTTPSPALHAAHGFREVRRAPTFARIGFDGGTGVLLRRDGREDQA